MTMSLSIRLLIYSALQVFLDFSHVLLLTLVAYSVSALSNDSSWLTISICLSGVVLVVAAIQAARSMKKKRVLDIGPIKKRLLQVYSLTEAEVRITLAYMTVLFAGSLVLLLLIKSWEALLITVAGNCLAWLLGKIFVYLAVKPTHVATKATRRQLRPWRNMAVDAIPLATFILGLALSPSLAGLKAIPVYLVLRHTCSHVFQLSLRNGMQKHFQTLG